jgi:hypothetical protein
MSRGNKNKSKKQNPALQQQNLSTEIKDATKEVKTLEQAEGAVKGMVKEMGAKKEEEIKPFEKGITEQKVSVVGDFIKIVALDPLGYYIAIDMIEIRSIKHVSYNVITDELVLVLDETTGRIGEIDVPIQNNAGHKTGGYRREVTGNITSYKTKLTVREDISVFLSKWLGVKDITEDVFEGFKHNNIAKEVFEKAAKLKEEQAEAKKNKSGLVDTAGQPLK